jgi:thiamine kinase-like enzyme
MPEPSRLSCCHNDLVAENIIATPEIHFLDWEYACDNDPMFDLATIVAHHELSNKHADFLLDAYFDGDGADHRVRLDRYVSFYNALLWLWRKALAEEQRVT